MNTRELGTFTGKVVVGIAKEKRVQQWKGWGGGRERGGNMNDGSVQWQKVEQRLGKGRMGAQAKEKDERRERRERAMRRR